MNRKANQLLNVLASRQEMRIAISAYADFFGAWVPKLRFVALAISVHGSLLFSGCGVKPAPSASSTASSAATQPQNSVPAIEQAPQAEITEFPESVASDKQGAQPRNAAIDSPKASAEAVESAITSNAPSANAAGVPPAKSPPPTPTAEQLAKWAVPNYEQMRLLACYDDFSDGLVQTLAVSPDGRQFVLGGARLTVWNTGETKPVADLLASLKNEDVERPIHAVAISPDGKLLAAGDHRGKLRVWNMSDRKEVYAIQAHKGRLMELAFSPSSQSLATTSYSGEVSFWQSTTGKKIKDLKASDREIRRLIFISDQMLAVAGADASLWDIASGKKEAVLADNYLTNPALALSSDRGWLAFADKEGKLGLWNVAQKSLAAGIPLAPGASTLAFSQDGKWIAGGDSRSTIRIWDAASRQTVQVLDADGGHTTDMKWLTPGQVLLVATERGRVRIWGTPASAKSIGVQPIQLPDPKPIAAEARKPLWPAQMQRLIDVRSFPRLPGSVSLWSEAGMASYTVPALRPDAELFYRYQLGKAGWTELSPNESGEQGMTFVKEGCQLKVSCTQADESAPGASPGLQVSLFLAGNHDVRWLPKISEVDSKSSWSSFSSVLYNANADITEFEVALLKQFHAAGWAGYTRLNASSAEDPDSRTFSMLQGGSELTVFIRHPADSTDVWAVQVSIQTSNKALPIPSDSGWIEYDASTDVELVANTKSKLDDVVKFYDTEMSAAGWLARQAGRRIADGKGFLPYIRGQQDVVIRLAALPNGGTRVLVGDAESSSWQFQKPPEVSSKARAAGIEAADFRLPNGATGAKYDVDEKQIEFVSPGVKPPQLAEQYEKLLAALDWKRDKSGVISDEYTLATYAKAEAEIDIRARLTDGKDSSVIVSGGGLLWAKPLPTAPVRLSYETWLRRNRYEASLDRLDQFAAEMHKIPAGAGAVK